MPFICAKYDRTIFMALVYVDCFCSFEYPQHMKKTGFLAARCYNGKIIFEIHSCKCAKELYKSSIGRQNTMLIFSLSSEDRNCILAQSLGL